MSSIKIVVLGAGGVGKLEETYSQIRYKNIFIKIKI